LRLSLVGFADAEIAAMLQTTSALIAQNLHWERKRASRKKPARKPKATGAA